MSNLRLQVQSLELYQLRDLRRFVGELIISKENETKKTVWRIVSGGVCHGNFREEEYLNAVQFLADMARKIDSEEGSDRHDRSLLISSERVPYSEYEGYFNG